ncbi:MAG TPA: CehA/McbA family metallohydrolase, partial [Planctomycetota bacterium]
KLVAGIRARGARVVILNHPRWPEEGKDPLTKFGFDERTGLNAAGQEFTFDAIEVVNSDAPTSPPDKVLPAWYALLERGLRFTAVGSSDSHAVGVIVGQGRTYVPSATDDPAAIDVDAACRAFLEGRVTVSLGIFATLSVEGQGMGETFATEAAEVEATVDLRYPSWITPRVIELVVNGKVAASVPIDATPAGASDEDGPTRRLRRVRLALPRPDSWIVAVVRGERVTAPFWAMSLPQAMAITNPVFVQKR